MPLLYVQNLHLKTKLGFYFRLFLQKHEHLNNHCHLLVRDLCQTILYESLYIKTCRYRSTY